jgi:hypothetical protein
MDYGAIDLHKKESQIRIVTETGDLIDQRIATTRDRFSSVFLGRRRMRILLEASTESEWVAQHLEQMGHEVLVADPNDAPMYGHRTRRIKTDRRDVAALRGLPTRNIPPRSSSVGPSACDPVSAQCPQGTDPSPDASDFSRAGDHARSRFPHPQRSRRDVSHAPDGRRLAGQHEGHTRAAV